MEQAPLTPETGLSGEKGRSRKLSAFQTQSAPDQVSRYRLLISCNCTLSSVMAHFHRALPNYLLSSKHQPLSPMVNMSYSLPHRNSLPGSHHLYDQGQKNDNSFLPWLLFLSENNLCIFFLHLFISL